VIRLGPEPGGGLCVNRNGFPGVRNVIGASDGIPVGSGSPHGTHRNGGTNDHDPMMRSRSETRGDSLGLTRAEPSPHPTQAPLSPPLDLTPPQPVQCAHVPATLQRRGVH